MGFDAYGQPVPTETHDAYRAKVSDGKSVTVTVPKDYEVEVNELCLIDGHLGFSFQSADEGEEVTLNVERGEFETDQIDPSHDYDIGAVVYFDESEGRLTEDETDRMAGIVTNPKDEDNVIWFLLTNFGFISSGGEVKEGPQGKSAYDIAIEEGFEGTESEWIESLKGDPGDKGDPFNYDDFTAEQLEELKGPKGDPGTDGKDGEDGKDGKDAEPQFTEEQVSDLLALIEE